MSVASNVLGTFGAGEWSDARMHAQCQATSADTSVTMNSLLVDTASSADMDKLQETVPHSRAAALDDALLGGVSPACSTGLGLYMLRAS